MSGWPRVTVAPACHRQSGVPARELRFARHGALGGLSVADFYSLLRFVPERKRQEFAARSVTCAPAPVTSHRGAQRRKFARVECLATVRFILVQRGSAASRGRRRRTRPDPSSDPDIRDNTPGSSDSLDREGGGAGQQPPRIFGRLPVALRACWLGSGGEATRRSGRAC